MVDSTILTITGDDQFLDLLRRQIHDQNRSGNRMIVAGTIDEACSLLSTARPRLIVVHWNCHGGRYEELNRLLWVTTVLARRVPVLVIADRYRVDQATTLYRMGVTDYISRTHHQDQFGRILAAYLGSAPASRLRPAASSDEPVQPIKAWSRARSRAAAHVV
jgi:DNA-binding NarL/FixJ family response regulator